MQCRTVEIVEVSPRDGLQNEQGFVATEAKLELISRAISMGTRRIEVTSFVNPRRVPQLADAAELSALLPRNDAVTYIGLVLNERGAERALAAGMDELGAVCIATDNFAFRNQGQSSAESIDAATRSVALARSSGKSGQITIGVAFGCPFQGEVPLAHLIDVAKKAADSQPREIALADTIGVAVPPQVGEAVERVAEAIAPIPVRIHLHNTRGTGIANAWAAVEAGVRVIDASLGGLGGCPFAPGAAGNIATEDLIYLLERGGIGTSTDLAQAVETASWLGRVIGRPLPGMVSRAPLFPSPPR